MRRKRERQLPPPFSASCSLSTSMAFRSPSQPPPPSAGLRRPEGLPPPPDALPLPRTHSRTQATRGWGDRREPGKRARERDRENEHLPEPLPPALQHGAGTSPRARSPPPPRTLPQSPGTLLAVSAHARADPEPEVARQSGSLDAGLSCVGGSQVREGAAGGLAEPESEADPFGRESLALLAV